MSKRCERCSNLSIPKQRFCNECRKQLLLEMKEKGYLTPAPIYNKFSGGWNKYRSQDEKENINETKRGI